MTRMPSPINSLNQPNAETSSPQTPTVVKDPNPAKDRKTVLESHGYYLAKTIGAGSYATVRMARSDMHGCNVAIKIVSKYTAPEDYLKKFLPREIEVVKGLKHPNLIRFLQAIETTHRVYIVMEFAENGSLLDIIRKDTYIDETRGRKWFRQLVDAIEYCHERGVVHRDIKCENLLMDKHSNIKVSDFGFARGNLRTASGQMILSETFCGSYAYASPEILKGIPYHPQLSDIWSMGVVLYAMVFGRLPFDDTNYSMLLKQVSNKVVFPREPKVSTICKALINKILAPLKIRIRVTGIKNDTWYVYTGSDKPSSQSEPEPSQSKISDTETEVQPAPLLTKQQLKEVAAKKPRQKRYSTDEEKPVAYSLPDDPTDTEADKKKK